MLIKIGEFECTECWDGVFYKKLANYPVITEWEIQTVLDFEHYEKQNGSQMFMFAWNILVHDEILPLLLEDYPS